MPLEIKDIQNLEERLQEFETRLKQKVTLLERKIDLQPKDILSFEDARVYFKRNGKPLPKSTFRQWWNEWQIDPRYKKYFIDNARGTAMLSVWFFHQWINDKDVDSILRKAS